MDLACNDLICPICGAKDEDSQPNDFICPNGCYEVLIYTMSSEDGTLDSEVYFVDQFVIFGEFIEVRTGEHEKIIDKINYWKENDRYLAKIISGDNNEHI